MKICVVNFSSKAMTPEVTCYFPFNENHIWFPAPQEDHTDVAVRGDTSTLHEAGLTARLLSK